MKPGQALLVERAVLVAGFVALVAAVAAFDWRLGLGLAGVLLCAASLDLRWRA